MQALHIVSNYIEREIPQIRGLVKPIICPGNEWDRTFAVMPKNEVEEKV